MPDLTSSFFHCQVSMWIPALRPPSSHLNVPKSLTCHPIIEQYLRFSSLSFEYEDTRRWWLEGVRCDVRPPRFDDLTTGGDAARGISLHHSPCKQQYYYESFIISCGRTAVSTPSATQPSRANALTCWCLLWRFLENAVGSSWRLERLIVKGGDCGYFLQQRQFVVMMPNKRIISTRIQDSNTVMGWYLSRWNFLNFVSEE